MKSRLHTTVRTVLISVIAALGVLIPATAAEAIEFAQVGARVHEATAAPAPNGVAPPGAPVRQAGAHPDVTFEFVLPPRTADPVDRRPVEAPHRLFLDLPPGLIGNPLATVRCPEEGLKAGPNDTAAICPVGNVNCDEPVKKVIAAGTVRALFVDVSDVLSTDGFRTSLDFADALLDESRVAVTPGEAFDAPGTIRISYATSMELLKEGSQRLLEFVGKHAPQTATA